MKKIATIISLVTILISIHATAQIVPNGTMESWNNVGGLYEEPASWTSPNELTFLYFTPCTKDTDAVDGQYAARLQSYFLQPFSLNVPGAIGTGLIDATTQSFTGGFPLNGNNPAALIGYFKYAPVGSDSALIFSALFKWNTSTNKRDTLAIAYLTEGNTPNYTQFVAPFFVLNPTETPDSAIVIIATAKDVTSAQVGSVMYVDDIDMTNTVGVNDVKPQELSLYPNPADETVEMNIPGALDAQNMVITNISGTTAKQFRISSGNLKVNTKSFATGTYVCFVKNGQGKVVASGKITVQH